MTHKNPVEHKLNWVLSFRFSHPNANFVTLYGAGVRAVLSVYNLRTAW